MLTFQGVRDVDRLLVTADIYREEAEVYALQGQADNNQSAARRSLRLFLEAVLTGEANLNPEVIQKIETLRLKLDAPALPVETRLALLDYLDRLLALGDDFLATARLTRPDLQAAKSALDRPDIH